jgi:hypothetical protein
MNQEYLDGLKSQMGSQANVRRPNREPVDENHINPSPPEARWNPINPEGNNGVQTRNIYPDSLDLALSSPSKKLPATPSQPTTNVSRIQNNLLAFGGAGSHLEPKPTDQDASVLKQATQLAKAAYLQNKQRFQGGSGIFS